MLLDTQQLHFKHERAVRRDFGTTIRAVRQLGRDGEFKFIADLHQLKSFGPPWYHFAQTKADGLSALHRAIENSPVEKGAMVMDLNSVGSLGRHRAGAMFEDLILEATRSGYSFRGR